MYEGPIEYQSNNYLCLQCGYRELIFDGRPLGEWKLLVKQCPKCGESMRVSLIHRVVIGGKD